MLDMLLNGAWLMLLSMDFRSEGLEFSSLREEEKL
jgi:hypothetical protein